MPDSAKPGTGQDGGGMNQGVCEFRYPVCLFSQASLPTQRFFKWAMSIMAISLVIFAATLVVMAINQNDYKKAIDRAHTEEMGAVATAKAEILLSNAANLAEIHRHKEVSLENRAVQTRVEGLLGAYLRLFEEHNKKLRQ
jgi:hypothetical protein